MDSRARLVLLAVAFINAAALAVFLALGREGGTWWRLAAEGAVFALCLHWLRAYRRGRLPVAGDVPEAVLLLLIAYAAAGERHAADLIVGLGYGGLTFRCLYPGAWRSAAGVLLYFLAFLGASLLVVAEGRTELTPAIVYGNVPGFVSASGFVWFLGWALRSNEQARERERGLHRRLEHQAFHDALTGLPNRALLLDRLEHALVQQGRRGNELALLFLDLDCFKKINDDLGHAAGDELLREVARRLEATVRVVDTAARFGGDEFAILLEDGGEAAALRTADEICSAVRAPMAVAGTTVFGRASVGIALTDGWSVTADELLRRADVAMYRAKAGGVGGFEIHLAEGSGAVSFSGH